MNNKYYQNIYETYKTYSNEKLQEILSNKKKYKEEAIIATKNILKDRGFQVEEEIIELKTEQINNIQMSDNDKIIFLLTSMRNDVHTLKIIVDIFASLNIIGIIMLLFR